MTQSARLTSSTLICRGEPLSADLGGEIVLMSVESGKYYGLDEIGSDIWNRIAVPIRVEALCAALEAAYEADAGVIARDVLILLDALLAQGLIRVEG